MLSSFYSSNYAEYYWQKPHYDLANKIVHSNLYRSIVPFRTNYEYIPDKLTHTPMYFSVVPQMSWLYGNLDYSYNKYHRHYQTHDEWYPDRKNKSLGFKEGGFCDETKRNPKFMTLEPVLPPRG